MNIEELMQMTQQREASDLILTPGVPPILRIDKKLVFTQLPLVSPAQIDELLLPLLDEPKKEEFRRNLGLNFIYSISGWGRFRVNLFKQRGSTVAVIRRFHFQLPSIEELLLPEPVLKYFCGLKEGLVLVTGPSGGGKSTTLACMIRMLNDAEAFHIITVEENIEYLFKHNKSVIEQRSIPHDSPSFSCAIKESLYQSPDVVVVGEILDAETLRQILRVAESGILVLATFHTATTSDTIDRLINFFPGEESQVRLQLTLVLRGVFSQQLIPMYQKQGVVPAWEVLNINERIKPLIREGSIQQINNVIETGAKFGMQSMDQTLLNLYNKKLISKEDCQLRLRYRTIDGLAQKGDYLSAEKKQESAEDADSYNPNF